MTGGQNSVKRSSRMINSHDKQVDIIRNNPDVILSVTRKYDGKAFPFSVTCSLPIIFDYHTDSYIHLSFLINTPAKSYNFPEGEMDKRNPFVSYTVIIQSFRAKLINLVTPKYLRNQGFASAILDIVSEVIKEYNKLIKSKNIHDLKDYSTIDPITGYASSCDEDPKLNNEQLKMFYKKHGFEINEKGYIKKSFTE